MELKTFHWTITEDKIEGGDRVGVVGPRQAHLTHEEIVNHPDRKHFRMYDDDGEHYYSGFMIHGPCETFFGMEESDGFEPLDGFGAPNAGCTSIHYRRDDGTYSEL